MKIEAIASVPHMEWLQLRAALWPDTTESEHMEEMAAFIAEPARFAQFIARDEVGAAVGFAEASVRHDYVNGTESSPVAFFEGLYVVPAMRQRGVARALFAAVTQWATARGCTELASDAQIENTLSHAVHRRLGFTETERVVYFRKVIA